MSKLKKIGFVRSKKHGPKFSPKQRLEIGLECYYSSDPDIAEKLSEKYNCSLSHIYNCRSTAIEFMDNITDEMITGGCFILDETMISAIVITLTLACRASLEGIQLFFQMIFKLHISIGKLSGIINQYAGLAVEIVEKMDYSGIEIIAADEIYMGHDEPILVVIDALTTTTALIKPEKELSAEIWCSDLTEVSVRNGLHPSVAVNDSGSSLMKGIPMAIENIEIQPDVFHTEMDLGCEIAKFTNYAESLINDEQKLLDNIREKKAQKKTYRKLEEIQAEMKEVLPVADNVMKSYEEIKREFGFSGCRYKDSVNNVNKLLEQMLNQIPSLNVEAEKKCREDPEYDELTAEMKARKLKEAKALLSSSRKWKRYNSLRAAIHRMKKRVKKEGIFGFLNRLEAEFEPIAKEYEVPLSFVFETYRLCTIKDTVLYSEEYDKLFARYWKAQREDCLEHIIADIRYLISQTVRASSLVENTNHKIRPYIQMKKELSYSFCCLLQLFLNTKEYRRSIKGRAGKSPLELLTGQKPVPFLEQLGLD